MKKTRARWFLSSVPAPLVLGILGGCGLGLWLGGREKVTNFSHAGQNEGFTCILVADLDTGQGAVIMTNGDRGSGLFNEILRAIPEFPNPEFRIPNPYLISYAISTTRSSGPTCFKLCELPGRVSTAVPGIMSTGLSSTVMTPLPLST